MTIKQFSPITTYILPKTHIQPNLTLPYNSSRSTQGNHLYYVGPESYISSFVEIDPLVPMKILEGYLPYMGMVAILVM